jgi:hypothetical protein
LGTWIPSFAAAQELLQAFTGVTVAEPTVRRKTEEAGAGYVAWQEEEAARLARELPPAPPGPAKALLSVDGALVPLLHGEWGEVKTLVLGVIQAPVAEHGALVVHTEQLSYFSRMTDADTFGHLALVEAQRRGLERAGVVAAVSAGAEWIQKFIDFHRADAVRILDFPHAAERLTPFGDVLYGEGTAASRLWLTERLHTLKHEGPAALLVELRTLHESHAAALVLAENLAYLTKRAQHMQYPAYQAAGLPLGSGAVESGNKVVIETRLKGAGMHWSRAHVNPLVALRNIVCSDRWDEEWPRIAARLRQQVVQNRGNRRQAHRTQAIAHAQAALPVTAPPMGADRDCPAPAGMVLSAPPAAPLPTDPKQPYRPRPDHPWRHSPIGRARYQPYRPYEPNPPTKT